MAMTREERDRLRREIDRASRIRAQKGFMNCDPEDLTKRALEAKEVGYDEVGEALLNFRDKVVNVLLGEGWTVERIEEVAYIVWSRSKW